jgi:hypothetical protein
MAEAFFREVRQSNPGAGFVITSAKRSHREQLRLYQASLAGQNNGLPASPPGHSDHERGLAFDMARLNQDPLTDPVLAEAGRLWQAQGGVWGGTWSTRDPVHFAAPGGLGLGGRKGRRTRSSRRR